MRDNTKLFLVENRGQSRNDAFRDFQIRFYRPTQRSDGQAPHIRSVSENGKAAPVRKARFIKRRGGRQSALLAPNQHPPPRQRSNPAPAQSTAAKAAFKAGNQRFDRRFFRRVRNIRDNAQNLAQRIRQNGTIRKKSVLFQNGVPHGGQR